MSNKIYKLKNGEYKTVSEEQLSKGWAEANPNAVFLGEDTIDRTKKKKEDETVDPIETEVVEGKEDSAAPGVVATEETVTPVESTDSDSGDGSLDLINEVTDAYQKFKPTEEDRVKTKEEAVTYITELMDSSAMELPSEEESMETKVHFSSKYTTKPTIMEVQSDAYKAAEAKKADSTRELEELRLRAVEELLGQYNSTADKEITPDTT